MSNRTELSCGCGEVVLELDGKHIFSVECLCADCQSAGAFLGALPGAPVLVDEKGATRFVMHRKDRVRCTKGQDNLRENRLSSDTKSRRVVAMCCNTPMFLDFSQGHWVSLYGHLWPDDTLPPLDLRTMTRDTPDGIRLPDDVPNPKTHTIWFYAKLIGVWAAMGFRTPKIDYVKGSLDVQRR